VVIRRPRITKANNTGTKTPTRPTRTPDPLPPSADKKIVLVFVHGFLSSAEAWEPFERLIRTDSDLEALHVERFQYDTGLIRLHPRRRIPGLDTIAHRLRTRFEDLERRYRAVVIVSHSMGGLVTQRFVARMLEDGQGGRLERIKRIVMFACPTAGADFQRTIRTLAPFRHTQEWALRPLNAEIARIQEIILTRVVHAKETTDQTCPIPLRLYAGESDNIVLPPSALGLYPSRCTGVVAGDHATIIRPDSPDHESYQVLKTNLKIVLEELGD
jgi:pimeloyl-ACP methyl ester carboxylesterase